MSTRSFIGYKEGENKYKGIYCHFDGYIKQGVGETLLTHYQDEGKVKKLIALGDLSSLGEMPESDPILWDIKLDCSLYRSMSKKFCKAYSDRDPSEKTAAGNFRSRDAFIKEGIKVSNGFIYLFEDGKWKIYNFRLKEFIPLTLDANIE